MASKSQAGRGTQFLIGGITGATGTETFTKVGEVKSANLSALKLGIIDVSSFDSGVYEEKQGTMVDPGTVSIKYNYIAGNSDAGQQALLAAQAATVPYDFKIILPKNPLITPAQTTVGDTITFSALVSSLGELTIAPKETVEGSAELTITGARTITPGS